MAEQLSGRTQRRRRHRRRAAAGVLALVVVVGGGAAAFAATSGKGSGQRIATATVASVTQTVESSGTIASARKSASAFSVSGTVNDVGVKVGDTVHKGQLLARLDASSLQTTVDTAAATLATAQQRLETDKTGQTGGSSGADTTGTGTGTSGSGISGSGTSASGTRAATSSYVTRSGSGSFGVTEVDAVTSTSGKSGGGTSLTGVVKQVVAAQNAVTGGQKKVDATQSMIDAAQKTVNLDIAQNTKFRDAQQTSCAADGQADGTTQPAASAPVTSSAAPTPTPTASTGPTTVPTTAPTASPSSTPPSSSPPSTVSPECASAMANYQAFATTLSRDTGVLSGQISAQDGYLATLQTAMKKLDALVGQLQQAAAGSGSGGGTATTGPGQNKSGSGSGQTPKSGSRSSQNKSGQNQSDQNQSGQNQSGQSQSGRGQTGQGQSDKSQSNSGANKSGGSNSGSSGGNAAAEPASAAQLAADQASIDAATAQLGVAKQNLAAATLTSPIAGTVAAVGLTVGTASNGGTITIVGSGAQEGDVTVPLGQIDQVKVGQPATLAVDGVSKKVHGTVESVGVLSSTSGSSTTFPVTIALASASPALFDGSGADVVITTATARGVITVPNSAIHTGVGGRQTVTVANGDKTSTVPVTVGVSDSNRTQIKSGLKSGQQVVLADLSQPLPGSSTSANTGTGRFPGGFGGTGNIPNFGGGGRGGR